MRFVTVNPADPSYIWLHLALYILHLVYKFHTCPVQGRTHQGGTRGTCPPGGREVPQLIEGSESCQPEVKASKSDKGKWYSVAR